MREKRASNPEQVRKWARDAYQRNGRRHNLKWKFGLTPEGFAGLLIAQSGMCYLCEEPLMVKAIHIDHDRSCCPGNRSCGRCVRGLAHQKCNQGIGQFGDDPDRLRLVAKNLERALQTFRSTTA